MIYPVALLLGLALILLICRRDLGRQKELVSTTLKCIGDAVIVTDAAGKVTFLNPVAERLTGWSAAEAAGRPLPEVFRIVNEETRRVVENPVEKVLRLGGVVGLANHTVLLAKDGREIPIDDSAAPIRGAAGGLFGVVLVFRDVSERRKADEARGRLAAIVDSTQTPIISKGLDGIIRTWNPGAERLFGYTAAEIVGKPITLLLPPERLYEEDEIMARLRQGKSDELLDTVRMAKDGRRLHVSVRVNPIKDREGKVIGAAKLMRDIGESKRMEEEIRRTNASLEARVVERTEELSRTLAELERFTYTVAHDLRAPLRGIHRYSEVLLAKGRELPEAEAQSHLRSVAGAAKRMDQMIGDLLAYSRIGLAQAKREPLDLERAAQDAVAALAGPIAERGAEVKVSGPFPRALADKVLLSQVLASLLSNALKFSPPGRKPRVELGATAKDGKVRLWVQDNGIGIEPRYHDRVFRLFERLHAQDEYPGTGVGLAIVSRAAERMGGRAGFDSEPGKGSRFWIDLAPAADA